jgi:hypothetical protein
MTPRRVRPPPNRVGGTPGVARLEEFTRSSTWHPKGKQFERMKSAFLAMKKYQCAICGCYGGPGSELAIDHIIPLSELAVQIPPIDPMDMRNWQPAHHRKPCPFCSELAGRPIRCNILKASNSTLFARQKIANMIGKPVMGTAPNGSAVKAGPPPRRKPDAPVSGEREW